MKTQIAVQTADAVELSWKDVSSKGRAVVAENDVFWVANFHPEAEETDEIYIHRFVLNNNAFPVAAGRIRLPFPNENNSGWNQSFRKPRTPVINYLRICGQHIWAADYSNGVIYRLNKDKSTDFDADIIFCQPRGATEIALQFYDVAFQNGNRLSKMPDMLWVSDGHQDSAKIYSIALPSGFDGPVERPLKIFNSVNDISTFVSKPSQFGEITSYNDKLWIMCYDLAGDMASNNKLIVCDISNYPSEKINKIKAFPVKSANCMVADINHGIIFIGTSHAALYKIKLNNIEDIPPEVVRLPLSASADEGDKMDLYRMAVDHAGYIWATSKSGSTVCCYSPLGTLSRQYTLKPGGLDGIWWSPAPLLSGNHIAVTDAHKNRVAVFSVDAGFEVGDFELSFGQNSYNKALHNSITRLPLRAKMSDNNEDYKKQTSVTLMTCVGVDVLSQVNMAVEILPNNAQQHIFLPKVINTIRPGVAIIRAEARTTSKLKMAMIKFIVTEGKIEIDYQGSIFLRQGYVLMPKIKIKDPLKSKGVIRILDPEETGLKFSDGKIEATIENLNGALIPQLKAGAKAGVSNITVADEEGNRLSNVLPVQTIPVPEDVEFTKLRTPVSVHEMLLIIAETVFISQGSVVLNSHKHDAIAPNSYLKFTVVQGDDQKESVWFRQGKNYTLFVTVRTDAEGKVILRDKGISLEASADFKAGKSSIKIEFNIHDELNEDGWVQAGKEFLLIISH